MLLLSGVKDEVVPREHMQGLWELVQNRVPGGRRGGAVVPPEEAASVSKDESIRIPGGNGYSRYVEFERGTHSKSFLSSCTYDVLTLPAQTIRACNKDTGRQSRSLLIGS